MNTNRYFKAKGLDLFNKISTPVFVLMVLFSPVLLLDGATFSPLNMAAIIGMIVTPVLFGSLLFAYMCSPQGFSVENGKVIVHKEISRFNSKFDLKEIEDVELASQSFWTFRTFGVGGVWGYFGYFNGNDLWYVTQLKENVVLKTKSRKIVLSPENPEEFISILKNELSLTHGGD